MKPNKYDKAIAALMRHKRAPGNEADGWTLPSEHDMRQFAEVVHE